MSFDIPKLAIEFDKVKIGWPWHGVLQQVSSSLCTLTSPSGDVVNFVSGDTSHPMASAVALSNGTSWRYGKCQRFQIPGRPVPVTTAAEKASGMTWLNWFCQSGIAWMPGGGDVLIDEDNKVWRTTIIYSGYVPTQLVIWHGVDGAWAEKMRVAIPNPGFVRSITNFFNSAMTCSSTGRLRVYSIWQYNSVPPWWCYSMTITGRVSDSSIAVSVARLIDSGISGLSGTDQSDTLYSGTSSDNTKLWLMRATKSSPGASWSAMLPDPSGQTTTWSRSNSYSNSIDPTPPVSGNQGYPDPPAGDELTLYAWSAHPNNPNTTVSDEYQSSWSFERTQVFAPWQVIGYFVGTDDQLVAVRSYTTQTTRTTGTREAGTFTNAYHTTTVTSNSWHGEIGGRQTVSWDKTQTIERDVLANQITSNTTVGSDGQVMNLLVFGYRAICITQKLNSSVLLQQYVSGQFYDAETFKKGCTATWPFGLTECPKFSVHPVTGEIITRVADGLPISWV